MLQGVSPFNIYNYIISVTPCQYFVSWCITLKHHEGDNMPSKKPTMLCRTNTITKQKIELIAKNEKRSTSNMLEIILEQYISQYEHEHGEIKVEED